MVDIYHLTIRCNVTRINTDELYATVKYISNSKQNQHKTNIKVNTQLFTNQLEERYTNTSPHCFLYDTWAIASLITRQLLKPNYAKRRHKI